MDKDKIGLIWRIYGDSTDIVSRLDSILKNLKAPIDDKSMLEDEVLFHLRKIVDKCDYIASEIEKGFKEELPKE